MIPVNEPLIAKNALPYVTDCIKTGWISSSGKYIDLFEKKFANYLQIKYAVTTTSGTTALHLAFAALAIGKGDEVILPDLTIISCALAVIYVGAKPVFIDVDPQTNTINPDKIEEKITSKTKAILVVHLYGYSAAMEKIKKIAKKHSLLIIEDVAEAIGCEYKGKKLGTLSDIACFSFYANKLITTGEGGMVVTNNKHLYERCQSLKNLAHSTHRRFLHREIGFNYRMTNLQAALGVAQLENIKKFIKKKGWLVKQYTGGLSKIPYFILPKPPENTKYICWMYPIVLRKKSPVSKKKLQQYLKQNGIETREYFIPLHRQPILKKLKLVASDKYPVSDYLWRNGFYIPSGLAITKKQVDFVVQTFHHLFL